MRILITGAGGFIGSHLVDRCREDGYYVIGLDKKPLEKWTVGKYRSDYEAIGDVVGLSNCDCEFDLCYHLAAESRIQPSFENPVDYVSSNVLGTAAVLEAANKLRARVVYAGSSTADDDTTKNVYAMSKWQGEELCRTWRKCFNADIGIARFYNVYGERHIRSGLHATVIGIWERQWLNIMKHGEKNSLTVTGTGKQKRDFTAVEDIVDGLVAIAEKGGNREYNLGTGENHRLIDVARMFVGSDSGIEFIPRPPGESEVTLADTKFTTEKLGWKAKRNIKDYIDGFKIAVIEKVMKEFEPCH